MMLLQVLFIMAVTNCQASRDHKPRIKSFSQIPTFTAEGTGGYLDVFPKTDGTLRINCTTPHGSNELFEYEISRRIIKININASIYEQPNNGEFICTATSVQGISEPYVVTLKDYILADFYVKICTDANNEDCRKVMKEKKFGDRAERLKLVVLETYCGDMNQLEPFRNLCVTIEDAWNDKNPDEKSSFFQLKDIVDEYLELKRRLVNGNQSVVDEILTMSNTTKKSKFFRSLTNDMNVYNKVIREYCGLQEKFEMCRYAVEERFQHNQMEFEQFVQTNCFNDTFPEDWLIPCTNITLIRKDDRLYSQMQQRTKTLEILKLLDTKIDDHMNETFAQLVEYRVTADCNKPKIFRCNFFDQTIEKTKYTMNIVKGICNSNDTDLCFKYLKMCNSSKLTTNEFPRFVISQCQNKTAFLSSVKNARFCTKIRKYYCETATKTQSICSRLHAIEEESYTVQKITAHDFKNVTHDVIVLYKADPEKYTKIFHPYYTTENGIKGLLYWLCNNGSDLMEENDCKMAFLNLEKFKNETRSRIYHHACLDWKFFDIPLVSCYTENKIRCEEDKKSPICDNIRLFLKAWKFVLKHFAKPDNDSMAGIQEFMQSCANETVLGSLYCRRIFEYLAEDYNLVKKAAQACTSSQTRSAEYKNLCDKIKEAEINNCEHIVKDCLKSLKPAATDQNRKDQCFECKEKAGMKHFNGQFEKWLHYVHLFNAELNFDTKYQKNKILVSTRNEIQSHLHQNGQRKREKYEDDYFNEFIFENTIPATYLLDRTCGRANDKMCKKILEKVARSNKGYLKTYKDVCKTHADHTKDSCLVMGESCKMFMKEAECLQLIDYMLESSTDIYMCSGRSFRCDMAFQVFCVEHIRDPRCNDVFAYMEKTKLIEILGTYCELARGTDICINVLQRLQTATEESHIISGVFKGYCTTEKKLKGTACKRIQTNCFVFPRRGCLTVMAAYTIFSLELSVNAGLLLALIIVINIIWRRKPADPNPEGRPIRRPTIAEIRRRNTRVKDVLRRMTPEELAARPKPGWFDEWFLE